MTSERWARRFKTLSRYLTVYLIAPVWTPLHRNLTLSQLRDNMLVEMDGEFKEFTHTSIWINELLHIHSNAVGTPSYRLYCAL